MQNDSHENGLRPGPVGLDRGTGGCEAAPCCLRDGGYVAPHKKNHPRPLWDIAALFRQAKKDAIDRDVEDSSHARRSQQRGGALMGDEAELGNDSVPV